MKIEEILSRIDRKDLAYAVGLRKISQLEKVLDDQDYKLTSSKEDLVRAVASIYGSSLFYESKIRHLIFYSFDEVTLNRLAAKYTNKLYEKPYDNALNLSLLPWKAGSEFVSEVADILKISEEYLPSQSREEQTIEKIEPLPYLFPLHNYQEELKKEILRALNELTPRFLIQMPTGAGKTRTVLQSLIEYQIGERFFDNEKIIIWLAHTEELCEQAIDTLKSLWLNLSSDQTKIIRCWGNFNPIVTDITGGFLFGTLQKFYGLLRTNSFLLEILKRKLKILVIDEAHKSTATSYSKIINHLAESNNVTLIGITATPGRAAENSKENLELANFYDKNLLSPIFQKNPIIELREKGILSRLNRQVIETKVDISFKENELDEQNEDQDIPISTIKRLANNVRRNKMIISIIEEQVKKKNPCLVFTCSVEHSNLLSAVLNFKGIKAASIDSKMNKFHRKIVIQDFKQGKFDVLFNYGVLSTGFDAPRIRTIIVARPTSSVVLYSQIIGRGLRGPKMGGSETCNLIDIKDNFKSFGGVEDVYSFFENYWN